MVSFKTDWQTALAIAEGYMGYLGPLIMAALERKALRAPVTELGGLLGGCIIFESNEVFVESGRGAVRIRCQGTNFEVELINTRSAG